MTLWPKLALTGIAIASALLGGIKLGADHVQGKWEAERSWQAIEVSKAHALNAERRAAADAALAGVQSAVTRALQEARSAKREPIKCPESGDVRDAVLPDLGDRLRAIRAAAGQRAGTDVAPVGSAGPAAADDGGAVRGSAD